MYRRVLKRIEDHKEEILLSSEWLEDDYNYSLAVMLAPLPAPLPSLNGTIREAT